MILGPSVDQNIKLYINQSIMQICSCFNKCLERLCLRGSQSKKKPYKSYNGDIEFQEEEFMNTNLKEQKQDSIEKKIQTYFQNDKGQHTNHHNQSENKQDIEDLIKKQLEEAASQQCDEEDQKILQEQKEEKLLDLASQINYKHFSINLDSSDPYFQILSEKTNNLESYFQAEGVERVISGQNLSNLTFKRVDGKQKPTYLLNFKLACSYSYYQNVLKNDKLLKQLSNMVHQTKIIESIKSNLTVNSLSFNQKAKLKPFEIGYLKYRNGGKNENWEVYLDNEKHEGAQGNQNCNFFGIVHIYEFEGSIQVKYFAEFGLKEIASAESKLSKELLHFLNGLVKYIEANYEKELI